MKTMIVKLNRENAIWAVDDDYKINLFYIKHQFICSKLSRLFGRYIGFYIS